MGYIFTGCRLVTASNTAASSASVFTSLLVGDCLATNSYSSHCRLKILSYSQLFHFIYPRDRPHRKHVSQQLCCCITYISYGPRREHRFPVTPLLCVTNLLRPLPSNDLCLQSNYLATAVAWLLISRSLSRRGFTCYNILRPTWQIIFHYSWFNICILFIAWGTSDTHNVLEMGSVSGISCKEAKGSTQLGPSEMGNLNYCTYSLTLFITDPSE
jgi:hypothetical protein